MQDYRNVETAALIELLALQTSTYTAKVAERNNSVELCQMEYEIALIQSELNSRNPVIKNNSRNFSHAGY